MIRPCRSIPATTLRRHLRDVIDWIENALRRSSSSPSVSAHDVTRYYRRAVTIVDADQLGGTMMEQLASLFDEEEKKKGWRPAGPAGRGRRQGCRAARADAPPERGVAWPFGRFAC